MPSVRVEASKVFMVVMESAPRLSAMRKIHSLHHIWCDFTLKSQRNVSDFALNCPNVEVKPANSMTRVSRSTDEHEDESPRHTEISCSFT